MTGFQQFRVRTATPEQPAPKTMSSNRLKDESESMAPGAGSLVQDCRPSPFKRTRNVGCDLVYSPLHFIQGCWLYAGFIIAKGKIEGHGAGSPVRCNG